MGDTLSNAEFAVLSLIAEAHRHGYEIERVIEARGSQPVISAEGGTRQ